MREYHAWHGAPHGAFLYQSMQYKLPVAGFIYAKEKPDNFQI